MSVDEIISLVNTGMGAGASVEGSVEKVTVTGGDRIDEIIRTQRSIVMMLSSIDRRLNTIETELSAMKKGVSAPREKRTAVVPARLGSLDPPSSGPRPEATVVKMHTTMKRRPSASLTDAVYDDGLRAEDGHRALYPLGLEDDRRYRRSPGQGY